MSTRATYHFRIRLSHDVFDVCFYVHCDNYPSGAASHLEAALAIDWPRQFNGKNVAKRFAALSGSEFTASHEDHGDTEYRYCITESDRGQFIEAYRRSFEERLDGDYDLERIIWIRFFVGKLSDFIAKYKDKTN